jgi:hypothetical protein
MSEEQKENKPTWLAKEFPTEWYFTEKFVDKLSHILDKMPNDTLLNFIEMPKIFGKSTKGNESEGNSAANLEVNPNFMALFGIMASTISETMSEVLKESQISSSSKYGELLSRMVKEKLALDHPTVDTSDHKKCNSCGTENRGMARYCDNCGLSFQG